MAAAVVVAIVAVLVALYYRAVRNIAMDKRLHLTAFVVYLLTRLTVQSPSGWYSRDGYS